MAKSRADVKVTMLDLAATANMIIATPAGLCVTHERSSVNGARYDFHRRGRPHDGDTNLDGGI